MDQATHGFFHPNGVSTRSIEKERKVEMWTVFLWYLILIASRVSLAIRTGGNLSYVFNVFDLQRFQREKITFPQVSIWNRSASFVAREVCEVLPGNYDRQYCQHAIANHVRISRMNFLNFLLYDAHQQNHVIVEDDATVTLEQFALNQNVYPRERDHEMIFVFEHFDSWDLDEDVENEFKTVCFLGESIRTQLLLAFLSLKGVRTIIYFDIFGNSSVYSDSSDSISIYLKTPMFKSLMKSFPNKHVLQSSNLSNVLCSVVILPSDLEMLYSAVSNVLQNFLLRLISTFPEINRVPFLWISNIYHQSPYESNLKEKDIFDVFRPHQTLFRWYLQTSWGINSFLTTTQNDQEGLPNFGQIINSNQGSGSKFLTSSLYVGYLLPSDQRHFLQRKQQIHSKSLEEITRENMVIILTYQVRAYAETAKGLKQQLQQELFYPHVLIIPSLTLEMMDIINDYLLDLTLDQLHEDSQGGNYRNFRKNLHVVQVILTPHAPSSHFVSSLSYPLQHIEDENEINHSPHRTVILSYILVQLEQEWLYRRFIGSFVAGVPLVNNARSIWTFSPIQREAVARTYFWQLEMENQAISNHFEQYSIILNNSEEKNGLSPFVHRSSAHLLDPTFINIVPIFAPCLSAAHMPCSAQFQPHKLTTTPVQRYTLVFFGLCSESRVIFLKSLFYRLQGAKDEFQVDLKQNCMLFEAPQMLVQVLGAFEGGHRDKAMLDRSTIVLNINNYNDSVLEVHRVMYLLSMGKCILSQRGRDAQLVSMLSPIVQGAVYWVDTVEDVLRTVKYLLTPLSVHDGSEIEEENVESDEEVAWKWISQAHGPRKRLAECERRSLEAYHTMHHFSSKDDDRNEDIDTIEMAVYGTSFLENAMDTLRQRLVTVEEVLN